MVYGACDLRRGWRDVSSALQLEEVSGSSGFQEVQGFRVQRLRVYRILGFIGF